MAQVVDIIPELKEDECFRIVNRHKRVFSYPVHRHPVMELNFIEHGNGARRIVRDSTEVIGDYDLVILGDNLEHAWEQGACSSSDISEMTVHFDGNIFLMNYRGSQLTYPDALRYLAKKYSISIPEDDDDQQRRWEHVKPAKPRTIIALLISFSVGTNTEFTTSI